MDLLENTLQPYAWGSHEAIARLQGRPFPTDRPEAELWMGAHPAAPSRLAGMGLPLDEAITRAPEQFLGVRSLERFGPRLPFLLKVLAARTPLSLQAHPSLAQAREGFAREEAAGTPPGAPTRSYKDPNHKPEILCALGPFWALYGFRDPARTALLLRSLGVATLDGLGWAARLEQEGEAALGPVFRELMTMPLDRRVPLVEAVVAACAHPVPDEDAEVASAFREERRWAVRLGELYPGDAGVVGALLLNLVRLERGDALYLPAGNLHAYLEGTGVELMASSDNVLRGGCTPKHVDVEELCRVLEFRAVPPTPLRPVQVSPVEWTWETAAEDFRLSRIAPSQSAGTFHAEGGQPEIVLCTEGAVTLEVSPGARGAKGRLTLSPGQSAFISADDGAWTAKGEGEAWRATTNQKGRPPSGDRPFRL